MALELHVMSGSVHLTDYHLITCTWEMLRLSEVSCARCQALVPRTWQRGRNEEFLGRAAKYAQRRKWGALLHACRTALAKVRTQTRALLPDPHEG